MEALKERIETIVAEKGEIDEISIREILTGEGFEIRRVISCGDADIFDEAINALITAKVIKIPKWMDVPVKKIREFRKSEMPVFSINPEADRYKQKQTFCT